jgi:hypothetical protein
MALTSPTCCGLPCSQGDSFTLGLLFITGANASAVNIFVNQIRLAYEASNITSEWKGVCTPNVTSTLVRTPMHAWCYACEHACTSIGLGFKPPAGPHLDLLLLLLLQAALGARFAVYSARVDRLQLLQIPYSDIVLPMAALPADRPPLTLVIAFA